MKRFSCIAIEALVAKPSLWDELVVLSEVGWVMEQSPLPDF